MTFLNPAVLFGLLAASIPILIHLFNLRKLKKIEFSTLAFLKELQKNKIRKIKLKQWVLLVLRVLIILLLVLAFARPALQGLALSGTTSAAKTTSVFIIDDTFSMSVIDNRGSMLNQAKAAAKNLLKNFQEGDEAAVILVSQSDRGEFQLSKNFSDIKRAIDAVEPAYPSGLLHNAISKAAQILSQSKNFNKEIYILSDFQSGRLADDKSISDFGQVLGDRVRIYAVNYGGKEIFNIGIDELKVNTQIFEKEKPVNFSVTLTNYSARRANNVVASLFVNNERSAQASTSLSGGESKILDFETVVKTVGYIDIFAEIEDDDILQDNRRFTNIFIPDKIPVIIFSDEQTDARFVELALTARESQNTFIITKKNLNEVSAYDLKKYETVIVIGSQNINAVDKLRSYVTEGGSLFIAPGSKSDLISFQNMLKSLGLPEAHTLVGKTADASNSFLIESVDLNHPIFQNIFTSKEKTKIESPNIYSYFRINTKGRGKNVISMQDGSAFLSEYKIQNGKILLMNSAPNLMWSSFPVKAIFAPLVNKSILYLASKDKSEMNVTAGNSFNIDLHRRNAVQLKVLRPDNAEEIVSLNPMESSSSFKYDRTNLVGNYKIFNGQDLIDEISVNADPNESITRYLGKKDLEDYLSKINFKGKFFFLSKDENVNQVVLNARFGSELWKHFLIAALLLAFIEMLVARNAKKDLVEMNK